MMPLKANRQQQHAEGVMMTQINEAKASVNLCNTITDVGEDNDLSDGDLAAVGTPILHVFNCMPHYMQMPVACTGARGMAGMLTHHIHHCSSCAHDLCYHCRPSLCPSSL